MSEREAKISASALARFVAALFRRCGMSEAHAATVADVLVWANLRGVDGHGVVRVPRYVELIEAGDINPRPALSLRDDSPAAALIEADRAPGPVAMSEAARLAVRKAQRAGVGLALVRATTHTAALGYYALACAREGCAAIALSASWPNMAYHGARAAGVSTNPIAIAVPRESGEALVLDMATGIVSLGKLNQARRAGRPIPQDWALDARGRPTTDPTAAALVLPMAGPKGSGLSLMIECLTSLAVGNPLISETLEGTPAGRRHRQNGAVIAIDLARFGDPRAFAREVERLARAIKSLPRAVETEEILLPGERAAREFAKRSRGGIPLPAALYDELSALAERLGVAPPTGRSDRDS